MAVGPGGVVAVGSGPAGGAMWRSADGVHWVRVRDAPLKRDLGVTRVLAHDSGYLAWNGRMLGSTDGRHWTLSPFPRGRGLELTLVGFARATVYAFGLLEDADGSLTSHEWISHDRGRSWVPVDTSIDAMGVHAIAELRAGRLLMAGTSGDYDYSGQAEGGAWTSTDGQTWREAGPEFQTAGSTDPDNTPQAEWRGIAIGPGGKIVVAGSDNERPAVVASADGVSWTRINIAPPSEDVSGGLSAVAATTSGFLAIGPGRPGSVAVWRSLDGFNWVLEPDSSAFDPVPGTAFEVATLVEASGHVVAGGLYPRPEQAGGRFSAATWITPSLGIDSPAESSACPPTVTLVSIANIPSSRWVACFGGRTITITGFVGQPGDCECTVNYFTLSPAAGPLYLNFEVYPKSAHAANPARWLQLAGHRLRVAGRFNDPSANACTADDVRPPADPVVTCRSRFVALKIEDLGKR